MIDLILTLLGAISYRIKGGLGNEWVRKKLGKPEGWEISNLITRGQWALFIATLLTYRMQHLFVDWISSALMFEAFTISAFIGVLFGYFGGQFDFKNPANLNMKNYRRLTLRGMFTMFPVALCALPFDYPNPWYAVAAGSLFVPLYLFIGMRLPKFNGVKGFSQWGEALYGGVLVRALII